MSTLSEIEAAADALPPEQAEQLFQHLAQRLAHLPEPPAERIAELHPGAFQPTADFDDPLPDEFWLGKEA